MLGTLAGALRTTPDLPVRVADPAEVDRQYRYWRTRILTTTIVGYALYYFVRTNIGVPLKSMGDELGYSKAQLGMITTVGGLAYGVSKFLNGLLGDHANPRYFMAFGLIASALMNVLFGLSSALWLLMALWFANNYFQGMGFPPCAKSMAHWFSPRERATTFGVWHTSHMIGAALVSVLTGYVAHHLGWRWCFYIPAAIAAGGAVIVLIFLRDTPGSMGLPPVEVYKGEESERELAAELGEQKQPTPTPVESDSRASGMLAPPDANAARPVLDYAPADRDLTYMQVVWRYVLTSPYMWLISVANLAVYVLRWAQVTWGPTFLQEDKGFTKVQAGWLAFGSEIGGMVGALVAGLAADRLFGGRAGRVCVLAMGLMAVAVYAFRVTPRGAPVVAGALFVTMGFFLYIPQMLIAAMAMNLGTKRASAAAVGLTGLIGYLSQIVTGVGIGHMVDRHGWGAAFHLMAGCAVLTLVLMAFTWNVGAHPHAAGDHR